MWFRSVCTFDFFHFDVELVELLLQILQPLSVLLTLTPGDAVGFDGPPELSQVEQRLSVAVVTLRNHTGTQ